MKSSKSSLTKVLILTQDALDEKMAGPAIRAFEFARTLSDCTEVTLVSDSSSSLTEEGFRIAFVNEDSLKQEVSQHDVIIFQGFALYSYPWISECEIIRIADLYNPMQLEALVQGVVLSMEERAHQTRIVTEALTRQLECADFVLCASEKQRDMWLGHLGAIGRLNQKTYDSDPSLRNLIDIVPFGIQNEDPVQKRSAIKGSVPGIHRDDKVVIWGGGIYNWFDPLILIRSISQLSATHSDIKLFFLGMQHPNPHVPAMRVAAEAQELARELDLIDKHVFFNQEWVKYELRADYLLDADLGISTHFDHIETAFSFRTRILDYLWAGLPIVASDGDGFASVIRENNLGLVVPTDDSEALSTAIEAVLYSSAGVQYRQNVDNFREQLRWAETLRPLIEFCISPIRAADRESPERTIRELERKQLKTNVDMFDAELQSVRSQLETAEAAFAKRLQRRVKRSISLFERKS